MVTAAPSDAPSRVPTSPGAAVPRVRVLKFGGTSVTSPGGIDVVASVVRERLERSRPVVVVSAFAGVTSELLSAARGAVVREAPDLLASLRRRHLAVALQLLGEDASALHGEIERGLEEAARLLAGIHMVGECSPKTLDALLSLGERLSAPLVAAGLLRRGVSALSVDARDLVVTDARFGEAAVDFAATGEAARALLASVSEVPVVTGFIGRTPAGDTTTLGRGGSDYTAAVLGSVLEAEAVEIWTDVPGVMSADPREVPGAFPLASLGYDELLELSHWGARVVHPGVVRPLRERRIPLHIRNTLDPTHPGTVVARDSVGSPSRPVRGVASLDRTVLLQIEGSALARPSVMSRLFSIVAGASCPLFVSQGSSERSVCVALSPEASAAVQGALEEEFRLERGTGQLECHRSAGDCSIVAVVGAAMRRHPGTAGRVFGILGNHGINIRAIAQGSSELSISFAVEARDRPVALRSIHDAFFAPRPRPAEVYVAGTGRVGSALLDQLAHGAAERHRLLVTGLARSGAAALEPGGIDLGSWRERIVDGGGGLEDVVAAALGSGRHPRIFVDCTASAEPVRHYGRLLAAGVAVVTANKIGFSGALETYRHLREAEVQGARFYHETTVGAALPVLGTLRDLVDTGDELDSLEGVLSGSLGFICDRLHAGVRFSEAVRIAGEKGFTEPDPRDDLSGLDVGRKLLILARQAGFQLEPHEVDVEPLLPVDPWAAMDRDELWSRLPEMDAVFEERLVRARAQGRRLAYVARLTRSGASARLAEVDQSHPCWSLVGAENLVAIRSQRYSGYPLVVRGPGAGPEVTAGGVLADLLRARAEAGDVPPMMLEVLPRENWNGVEPLVALTA